MILQGKQAEVITGGAQSSSLMGIDEAAMQIATQVLSSGFYKDPIGSIIREWTSNALDAHREIGVEDPVLVSLYKDEQNLWWLKVKDVGVGFSPDRQEKVLGKYFASTKRGDANQLGYYGLGLKSGLAYVNRSFTFKTVYEGIEYTYIMYEGEEGSMLNKIMENPTEDRNGTTFLLQARKEDIHEFQQSAKKQLAYFENVYFDIQGIPNDFTITKHDLWKHSTLSDNKQMHLCLDNVYYPIDFQKLGIDPISIPIALNFSVSEGIRPIPSREDIMYTPIVKKLILDRIEQVCNHFAQKWNERITGMESFEEAIAAENGELREENFSFSINNLSKATIPFVEPTIKGVEKLNIKNLIRKKDQILQNYGIRGKISSYYRTFNGKYESGVNIYTKPKSTYFCETKPRGLQLQYLKDKTVDEVYFLYKTHTMKLGSFSGRRYGGNYVGFLELFKYPKSDWRQIIKEFQQLVQNKINTFPKIEDVVPDDEWLKTRKESRVYTAKVKPELGEINPKWAEANYRMGGYKFVSTSPVEVSEVMKTYKKLIVYGTQDDKDLLTMVAKFESKLKIKVCILVDRDLKRIQGQQGFLNVNKLMEGNNKKFNLLASSIKATRFTGANATLFQNNYMKLINEFDNDLYDKMNNMLNVRSSYMSHDIETTILELAEEKGYWEPTMEEIYKTVKEKLVNFEFLAGFELKNSNVNFTDQQKEIIKDVLKYRKVKLNITHYTVKA